jgi:hypothetical protein
MKKSNNNSLYSNLYKTPKIISGYGTEKKVKETLKNLKGLSETYKMQIVNTMYNRAKYHKYQTEDMRKAMKIYKKWLDKKNN